MVEKEEEVLRCGGCKRPLLWEARMSQSQLGTIFKLLKTASKLAIDMEEVQLAFLIERAIDEAQGGTFPPNLKQAPYFPG
jgi:hypothetical protein